MLKIDALNELLEVAFDLHSRPLLYLLEGRELADRSLAWDVRFDRDGSQCANFLAEAHLALVHVPDHRWELDNFDLVPLGIVHTVAVLVLRICVDCRTIDIISVGYYAGFIFWWPSGLVLEILPR